MPFNRFNPAGGTLANIDTTYEHIGFAADGSGTQISNTTAHQKGNYAQLVATTTSALAGIWIFIQTANASGNRFLVDIAIGAAASETIIIPNLGSGPSTVGAGGSMFFFPLNIPAGTRISARCQASGASGSCYVSIIGEVRTANHPPLFDNCELLAAASTANTTVSSVTVTGVNAAGTGWTQYVAATARDYGALLQNWGNRGDTGAVPANSQMMHGRLATGAAASEVLLASTPWATGSTNPGVSRFPGLPIRKAVASGTRIALEQLAPAAGNVVSAQVYGLW